MHPAPSNLIPLQSSQKIRGLCRVGPQVFPNFLRGQMFCCQLFWCLDLVRFGSEISQQFTSISCFKGLVGWLEGLRAKLFCRMERSRLTNQYIKFRNLELNTFFYLQFQKLSLTPSLQTSLKKFLRNGSCWQVIWI